MSDSIAPALVESVRLLTNVQRDKARYDYLSDVSPGPRNNPTRPTICEEETVPGVELKNYVTRSEVEGDTHVLVIDHKEFLEKKRVPAVPPTAEEIAEQRDHKKLVAKLWAGVASIGILVAGVIVVVDKRNKQVSEPISRPALDI